MYVSGQISGYVIFNCIVKYYIFYVIFRALRGYSPSGNDGPHPLSLLSVGELFKSICSLGTF